MSWSLPTYATIPAEQLGQGTPVAVEVVPDAQALARHMAQAMLDEIQQAAAQGRELWMIVPVGPVDQFPVLAEMINQQGVSLRHVTIINMDEYLTDEDQWVPEDHPLSFRGFMNHKFYDLLRPELAPEPQRRIFPDPRQPESLSERIAQRGGVDVCFGGIGINGHMAFNEPPEPGETISPEAFADLPTRCLNLARETRTINSVTVGGGVEIIPRRAVTVGMRDILSARRLRFYCNRPWQRMVVRRVLHGPQGPACPASYLRTHQDARLVVTQEVASVPQIALR